jgi:tripartite-type tricarboxylate transporter receptor subunit TctC
MMTKSSIDCRASSIWVGNGSQEQAMITRRHCLFAAAAGALGSWIGTALAQSFPSRPITLVVPVPAGSSSEAALRALAAAAERDLGQPIIFENKPGASATLGTADMAANAKPDGYTLSVIYPTLFRLPFLRKTSFDPTEDFTYIISVAKTPIGLVVRADAPWRTFQEFLADAKANPGKITYGTAGVGSTGHVVMELLAKRLGVSWLHVPFKGVDDASALLGGHIQAVADPAAWAPQVNAGQLRLLVTFGAERTKMWPNVPTLKDAGFDVEADLHYGLAGPKGMDPAVVKRLHDSLKNGMQAPSFTAILARFSQEPFYLNSSDYRDFAMKEIARERQRVEELGLKEG